MYFTLLCQLSSACKTSTIVSCVRRHETSYTDYFGKFYRINALPKTQQTHRERKCAENYYQSINFILDK